MRARGRGGGGGYFCSGKATSFFLGCDSIATQRCTRCASGTCRHVDGDKIRYVPRGSQDARRSPVL